MRRSFHSVIVFSLLALLAPPVSAAAPPEPPASASVLAGYWTGTLEVQARRLRLLLTLSADGTGTLTSLDQGNQPRPLSRIDTGANRLSFETRGVAFDGRPDATGSTLTGTLRTGGGEFAFVWTRTAAPPVRRRPQEPAAPLPYPVEEVVVPGPGDLRFAGTLTRPASPAACPAVLLLSGSGPQDRDSSYFGHRPFLVLADRLTRAGFVVLRLDDRGAGRSTGSRALATIDDYVEDARLALEWLARRPEVDPRRLGVIGHSEGGLVAARLAHRTPAVRTVVLLAAPVMEGRELALLQAERLARAAGAAPDAIAFQQALNRRVFDAIATHPDEATARAAIRAAVRQTLSEVGPEALARADAVEQMLEPQIRRGLGPWFRHFLAYDPAPALRGLPVPALALFGERDQQVPADVNAPLARSALAAAGHSVVVLPELNHLLQTAATGAMTEYGEIEETLAPAMLEATTSWLRGHL